MSGAGVVVVALAAAASGAVGATRRLHERWRARWRLRNHVPLESDARENDLVYVSGIVRALDETLVAPLSGRECVAYRARIHGRSLDGTTAKHELMQLRPFAIDCDDGTSIVVDAERVMFGVAPQKLSPRNPERENNFRARHAIGSKGNVGFSEVIVEIGSEVLVGGTLIYVPCDDPPTEELGFRDPPPPEPQIVGNRDEPLVILARGS